MAEKPDQDQENTENAADSRLTHDFAGALGSILESASSMYATTEKLDIRFSVALVGEMRKEEFANLVRELPVVADIALSEDIGEKAAILIDLPTASALAGLISGGGPTEKDSLGEDDIASLRDALHPILDVLSTACEETTGRALGSIEDIEVADTATRPRVAEELPEALYRAMASVSMGEETKGRLALVLPLNLAEALAETETMSAGSEITPYEQVELEQEDAIRSSEARTGREPSMENIHLVMDIQLDLTARLGQVEMPVSEILKLAPGSVIDIDRFADEPIELVVNDRLIARGEIVVVQENFGIKITEILSPKERIESLR